MRCLDCKYSLVGLKEPVCPECGRGFDPADPGTFVGPIPRWVLRADRPLKRWQVAAAFAVPFLVWCAEAANVQVGYWDPKRDEFKVLAAIVPIFVLGMGGVRAATAIIVARKRGAKTPVRRCIWRCAVPVVALAIALLEASASNRWPLVIVSLPWVASACSSAQRLGPGTCISPQERLGLLRVYSINVQVDGAIVYMGEDRAIWAIRCNTWGLPVRVVDSGEEAW